MIIKLDYIKVRKEDYRKIPPPISLYFVLKNIPRSTSFFWGHNENLALWCFFFFCCLYLLRILQPLLSATFYLLHHSRPILISDPSFLILPQRFFSGSFLALPVPNNNLYIHSTLYITLITKPFLSVSLC